MSPRSPMTACSHRRGADNLTGGGVQVAGAPPGLQNRSDPVPGSGGFDSRPPPPMQRGGHVHEAQPPDARRRIPRTDDVLADPRLAAAAKVIGRSTVKQYVVDAQQRARRGDIAADAVADTAVAELPEHATTLRDVVNATGVVLHTNLGRAALSAAAVEAIRVAAGHTDVEYDLATGARARRGRGTLHALAEAVPAAEDVHVVNNGAAALVL